MNEVTRLKQLCRFQFLTLKFYEENPRCILADRGQQAKKATALAKQLGFSQAEICGWDSNYTHFVLIGTLKKPMACGNLLQQGVPVTNQWQRVTCPDCLAARYDEDRPDKKVLAEHKKELKKEGKS